MSSLPSDLDLGVLLAEQHFVRRLARTLVANADDAEDVAQLTWLQALRHPLRQRTSARAFLGQVTRHVASNFRRSDARRRTREAAVGTTTEATSGTTAETTSVADAFARESLRQQVVAELAALPEPYRRTLVARFFDDLAPHLIAQREGAPDATVRARLKRGLDLLRQRLDLRYGGDRSAWCTALLPLTRGGMPAGSGTAIAAAAAFGWQQLLLVGGVGVVLAAGLWWLDASATPAAIVANEPAPAALQAAASATTVNAPPAPARTTLGAPSLGADDIDDAMPDNGIRGRLVLAGGRPAAGRKVELIGLDPSRLFDGDFSQLAASAPISSASTVSDGDGRFLLANVRPRALFVLQAGRGQAESACVPVTHTAGSKHVVDLGDITLQARGTVRGRAVDPEGQPIAGAEVWAADMPGLVALAVNVDRCVPEHGGMLLLPRHKAGEDCQAFAARMRKYLGADLFMDLQTPGPDFDAHVLDTPAWFTRLWEALPMARTTTASDGTFTLRDVEPANNMLVLRKPGFDRGFKPTVKVGTDTPRDVGDITLPYGESLTGSVLGADDRPIARAAVRVAMLPIGGFRGLAFSEAEVRTDGDGKFVVPGLRRGKVLAAARQRDDDPWTVSGPLDADGEAVLRLPARGELVVRVLAANAAPPSLRLSFGPSVGELARMGLRHAVALEGRVHQEAPGILRVRDLAPGSYQVEIAAQGSVTAHRLVQVPGEVEVALEPAAPAFDVLVVSTANAPVAGARVRCVPADQALARAVLPTSFGLNTADVLATSVGCTDRQGRLRVAGMPLGQVTLWADHPAYGVGAARGELPAETVLLRLPLPATIDGVLLDAGVPALATNWRIAATADTRSDGIERPYALAAPAADGSFKITGLDPGAYTVRVLPALAPRLSLSALQALLSDRIFSFFLDSGSPRSRDVVLAEGETRALQLDVSVAPAPAPTEARVVGRVTVNGVAASGVGVRDGLSWFRTSPNLATTAADGSYSVVGLAEGSHTLTFVSTAGYTLGEWPVSVAARGDTTLDVDVHTSSLAGRVIVPAERTLTDARVSGRNAQGRAVFEIPVQADGSFRAEQLPCGTYSLTVEAAGITGPNKNASVTLTPERGAADIELVAEAAYELEVKIEGQPAGEPCFVELRHETTGSIRVFQTGDGGIVRFHALQGGKHGLKVKTLSLSGEVELGGHMQHRVVLTARGVVRLQ